MVDYLDGHLVKSPRGQWLHFGYDDVLLRIHKDIHLHIPVRNPIAVATSWAGRGKNLDRLLKAYDSMFRHLDRPHTLHRIEDIPATGTKDWDREIAGTSQVPHYIAQVTEHVIAPHQAWFRQYYEL